jgi:transcriptional regulator with XRE-family HTH domain
VNISNKTPSPLARLRIGRGMTQADACDALAEGRPQARMKQSVYSRIENGRDTPTNSQIDRLAVMFSVTPEDIIELWQASATHHARQVTKDIRRRRMLPQKDVDTAVSLGTVPSTEDARHDR